MSYDHPLFSINVHTVNYVDGRFRLHVHTCYSECPAPDIRSDGDAVHRNDFHFVLVDIGIVYCHRQHGGFRKTGVQRSVRIFPRLVIILLKRRRCDGLCTREYTLAGGTIQPVVFGVNPLILFAHIPVLAHHQSVIVIVDHIDRICAGHTFFDTPLAPVVFIDIGQFSDCRIRQRSGTSPFDRLAQFGR